VLSRERRYLIRTRMIQLVPVLLLVTFFAFLLLHITPGDPALLLAGDDTSRAHIAEIRHLYGLDRPLLVQYATWLGNALHGDLSKSLLTGEPVAHTIGARFPATLLIVCYAMVIAIVIGVPLGVLAAARAGGWLEAAVLNLTSVGVAVPYFWLAMLLVSWFALQLPWFPATGSVAFSTDPIAALHAATLPALALAAGGIAEIARQMHAAMADLLRSPHVRTLRAKGLSPAAILFVHGLKNVGVTLLTVIGLIFNRKMGATVVVETVFAIPGIGSTIVVAAVNKDYAVVQGIILVLAFIVIGVNLCVDMLYVVLDPRIE
jgi:peptide/nickel transport system permease protein